MGLANPVPPPNSDLLRVVHTGRYFFSLILRAAVRAQQAGPVSEGNHPACPPEHTSGCDPSTQLKRQNISSQAPPSPRTTTPSPSAKSANSASITSSRCPSARAAFDACVSTCVCTSVPSALRLTCTHTGRGLVACHRSARRGAGRLSDAHGRAQSRRTVRAPARLRAPSDRWPR